LDTGIIVNQDMNIQSLKCDEHIGGKCKMLLLDAYVACQSAILLKYRKLLITQWINCKNKFSIFYFTISLYMLTNVNLSKLE